MQQHERLMRVNIRELADATMRHYGCPKACTLAHQYSTDAAALGDHPTRVCGPQRYDRREGVRRSAPMAVKNVPTRSYR